MENPNPHPLRRHPALQPLSRANHQGLMFCLLLDKGLRKEVATERMRNFSAYFFDSYWKAHRERLRDLIQELLATSDPLAMEYRQRCESLTACWAAGNVATKADDLRKLKDSLRSFIRWQERELFMDLQAHHREKIELLDLPEAGEDLCAVWPDPFWE